MKLDYLFFGAHPDDVELSCSGTILMEKSKGRKIGIVDFTRGELGSRGSVAQRNKEAARAAEMMDLDVRVNLDLRDGFFLNDEAAKKQVIVPIRRFRPDIVIGNAPMDRHPDHARASVLLKEAAFLSGLKNVSTIYEGQEQAPHRPYHILFYVQDMYMKPDFVIVTPEALFQKKIEVIQCFESQFFSPSYQSEEAPTYISTPEFLESLKSRFRQMGKLVGATYGEGFLSVKTVGLPDFSSLVQYPF